MFYTLILTIYLVYFNVLLALNLCSFSHVNDQQPPDSPSLLRCVTFCKNSYGTGISYDLKWKHALHSFVIFNKTFHE